MILLSCLLWLSAAALTWWLLHRQATAPMPAQAPPVPPDPIAAEVGKWMHDWDRGRA